MTSKQRQVMYCKAVDKGLCRSRPYLYRDRACADRAALIFPERFLEYEKKGWYNTTD